MPNQRTFAIDAAPGLIKREAGSAALTTDGYVGAQHDQGGAVLTPMVCRINVETIKVSAGNEEYTFRIVLSNDSGRSDSVVVATEVAGDASVKTNDTVDTLAGDTIDLRFHTMKADIAYRYVDLHLDVGGTAPSIAFAAFISKEF
jgi:hypothetical protein